ncbi:sugar ABC transporter substrate-binding protein [Microbacterium sp. UMB0228]|uniref:extracellular solute-binding protein n=1 Tax=Microbacterium sp. UMB0228 TaxID=2029109 RepID=UPI000C80EE80|nr:extracellular solute-binding protein [Microbacterium sp. UMB0228]PMC02014.1 sugar ABC transporter substrate-binding protein [Microbacterium sp. UMB0228]
MKARSVLAGIASASVLLTLAACSNDAGTGAGDSGDETGTVRLWVMEGSLSDESRQYLEEQFAEENPGSELKVEVQQWDGIVSKLQTSLASKNESPDLVEIGNTQTSTFTSVGAFADVTDLKDELGGDDLIPSFVDASTIDGKIYAYPLYAGARGVFYRTDLFEQAGISVPTTIEEFSEAAIALQAANPEGTPNFSGMYVAAVDPHGVESYLFPQGFEYAEQDGDEWVGAASTDESLAALTALQDLFQNGTTFALDSQAGQKSFERYFNEGSTGILIGTGNIGTKIDQALWDAGKVGVFAIPSDEPGVPGATFAGGSNIAMATNSPQPELATKALELIFSEDFQTRLAEEGWVPGNTAYSDAVAGPFGEIAGEIITNSKLTPNSPEWGVAFGSTQLNEFFTRIAKGEDVAAVAASFDEQVDTSLNK